MQQHKGFIFFLFALFGATGIALFNRYFLRIPDRIIPGNSGLFVSPANGIVASVKPFNNEEFFVEPKYDNIGRVRIWTSPVGSKGTVISITLNITNVHYQRAPVDSILLDSTYTPGSFINAISSNKELAQQANENNSMLFVADAGYKYKIVQIAGLLARTIEGFVDINQRVKQGEIIGVIKLGSQVTIILPEDVKVRVKAGDILIDGETVIGTVHNT